MLNQLLQLHSHTFTAESALHSHHHSIFIQVIPRCPGACGSWSSRPTYLLLLKEEHGTPLNNLMKNSLLFGLLGTEGHKHFSGNPAIELLNMATYTDFSKVVREHFERLVNTACAI